VFSATQRAISAQLKPEAELLGGLWWAMATPPKKKQIFLPWENTKIPLIYLIYYKCIFYYKDKLLLYEKKKCCVVVALFIVGLI
jgi:hypothetical protein